MPQLDIYVVNELLVSVIWIFIWINNLNISETLIIINLILRIRKLKVLINKKYINMILKQSLHKLLVILCRYLLWYYVTQLKLIKKYFIDKDILDINNIKKK